LQDYAEPSQNKRAGINGNALRAREN